jgi:putative membrane protein
MSVAADIAVALVAALHLGFLVLEMFLWDKPLGRRIFRLSPELAAGSKPLAMILWVQAVPGAVAFTLVWLS